VGAGTVAGLGAGGVLLTTRNEPVLAQSGFTASDVSIDSNDGSVSELTINPEPTVDWANLEETAVKIVVSYRARLSGDSVAEEVAGQEDTSY